VRILPHFIPPFVHKRFVVVWQLGCIPDFGRNLPSRAIGLRAASPPCSPKFLPKRSRAHAFTDGRVFQIRREADNLFVTFYGVGISNTKLLILQKGGSPWRGSR
jgi:hypothetical protein